MEPYIGEIRMFAGNYAPQGWALCQGQLLSISENEVLYTLIGTTYGGDGQTTFALPDLRSRVPIHMGQNPQTHTNYTLGATGGTETETLTQNQLPAHSHTPMAITPTGTENSTSPSNAVWATTTKNLYATAGTMANMNASSVLPVGGNQSHDNMMPSLGMNFIIALQGTFPSQQ